MLAGASYPQVMSSTSGLGVLITGASRGLGRALAEQLAERGARLALVSREPGPLSDLVATLRARGATAHALAADIADKSATHRIAGQAQALIGQIDVAIHNASTLGPTPLRLLLDTECEDLAQVLDVNLLGPFRLTRAIVGGMVLRGRGLVLQVTSDASVNGYPTWGAYGVSKAAQDHLSRILAAELDGTGVRVIAVDPGEMDTVMHAAAMPDADRATLQAPATVAARIIAMLEQPERARSGMRLVAPQWESP